MRTLALAADRIRTLEMTMADDREGRPKPPWVRISDGAAAGASETPEEAKTSADHKSMHDLANDLRRLVRGDQRRRAQKTDKD